ncbi:hypothetical protein RvY_18695, partial [Ramazzottius varieornatus]
MNYVIFLVQIDKNVFFIRALNFWRVIRQKRPCQTGRPKLREYACSGRRKIFKALSQITKTSEYSPIVTFLTEICFAGSRNVQTVMPIPRR